MNLKTLIRYCCWFVNFGNMIRLTMRWLPRGNRTFFIFEGKSYSYRQTYDQSARYAAFFKAQREKAFRDGRIGKKDKLAIGIYQENSPEFLFAAFGAALANCVLYAINTGFKGKTLSNVMNLAGICLLIASPETAPEVKKNLSDIHELAPQDVFIVGCEKDADQSDFACLEKAVAASEKSVCVRSCAPMDNTSPVLVIYTSGTTGTPKGVPCTHLKMIGAGFVVQSAVHLAAGDRGYICMPLFHSNAWYIGILPALLSGSSFVLKRRFSASAFEEDMLAHGVTFMNYVGQTLHYIIAALENKYGDGDMVESALAWHPKNRFRKAYGNGAPAVDRRKCMKYLNMEHIFEIYGSTEAVITSANKPGDPIDSVGEVPGSVVILNENDRPCAPGIADNNGRLLNYAEAVGEICKKTGIDNLRFDGYVFDDEATGKKFRHGYYHSGDLGHIRMVKGKRYLYFNGRTDDWIRKDGENFSAENVMEYTLKLPGVKLAIAYGAPCEVSDEKVMVTIQLHENAIFDPEKAFDWFMKMQKEGGMDPKWMPDYIRIYEAFSLTDTQKILVRPFKSQHFNLEKQPDMIIYFRRRGDNTYRLLVPADYEEIKEKFIQAGREALL